MTATRGPVLITGATGFVGQALCRSLRQAGWRLRTPGRSDIGDSYCVAGTNSIGLEAAITAVGSAVAGDNDLTLSVRNLPPNTVNLFLMGANARQFPFGDGYLCVGSPLMRIPPPTVANADGDITEREMTAMLGLAEEHFQMPRGDCEALLSEARWLAKEAKDLSAFLQRLSQPIAACCTEQELADLFAMLEAVDRVEGGGSAVVADAVANLQRRLAAA